MDPSSETTHATHCIQSSTSSEQLHAKRQVDGRERRDAEEELEMQEEKININ